MVTANLMPMHIVSCRNLQLKNVVMVMIHFERFSLGTVRQLHTRRTCSFRILRRITSSTNGLDFSWDPGINLVFSEGIRLFLLHVPSQIHYRLQLICYGGQSHLYHLGSDLIHDRWFPDHHYGVIEMLHVGGRVFPTPKELIRTSLRLLFYYYTLVYFEFSCFLLFETLIPHWLYSETGLL